ncbi:MAG TPA: metalloregulator ArsR/SmtB family transcription factor [Chloroflexota bacterium]|nr:metalloregulator ArsR/SmtB family transcription factor [Chloroflexota bacterium]
MSAQSSPLKDPTQVARARRRLTPTSAQRSIDRVQRILCEPARLKIVQALTVGPICVADLAAVIDRPPAATSQHLRVLRTGGIVDWTRRGTTIYYHLRSNAAAGRVQAVLEALERDVPPPP